MANINHGIFEITRETLHQKYRERVLILDVAIAVVAFA